MDQQKNKPPCVASVLLNAFQFDSKILSSSSCNGAERSPHQNPISQVSKIDPRATPQLLQNFGIDKHATHRQWGNIS